MAPRSSVHDLEHRLTSLGTAARAAQEKRYLKSDLRFLGVTVPVLRREAKAYARAHPALGGAALMALSCDLWSTRIHELRSFALALLELRAATLDRDHLDALLQMVREAQTWAHVDWLATKVLGNLVARGAIPPRTLMRWAADPDFWVRRTALLVLHDPLLAGQGDFELFARLAAPMLGEREFFIRKAIGWVLRSTAKRRPELTRAFVREHAQALSALSYREATRNLPASMRAELDALRHAAPAAATAKRGKMARKRPNPRE